MLQFETAVDAAVRTKVQQQLQASNDERSSVMRELRARGETVEIGLDVYAYDGGELVGGLTGETWASWLTIELLWVRADRRSAGLGGQLLERAEWLARDRGCVGARLETWDFQARPFYEEHGYVVFGVLEGYPPGAVEYHLAKRLD